MGIFLNKANNIFGRSYDNDKKFIEQALKNVHNNLNLYQRPETYKTLLKHNYGNNSDSIKVRRKMNNLINKQLLMTTKVKYGKGRDKVINIFFPIEKDYFIIICKSECYYCDKTSVREKDLVLRNAFKLYEKDWKSKGNVSISYCEVIKCL